MDLRPIYTMASRDIIVLTSEVARLDMTISHFKRAEIQSVRTHIVPVHVEPVEVQVTRMKDSDRVLQGLLDKATKIVSEIPPRRRTVAPMPKKQPVERDKVAADRVTSGMGSLDYEKVKKAAHQARVKAIPQSDKPRLVDKLRGDRKLVKWAERRVVNEKAPEVTDIGVNSRIVDLAVSTRDYIESNESSVIEEDVLRVVSLLNWVLDGHLLTFWQDPCDSPQIHNA